MATALTAKQTADTELATAIREQSTAASALDTARQVHAKPPEPKLKPVETITNYTRSFLELVEALGNHKNTELTYDEFRNGKFIPTWDLRLNPNPEPGEVLKQPSGSLRLQAEFHKALREPLVMLCFFRKQRVVSAKAHGGGIGHV